MGIPLTPVLLTPNEEPNLQRTLESFRWASRVVILDSGSTDATERIAKSFANAEFYLRRFDNHRNQWSYAIHETGIDSDFVFALDADMTEIPSFLEEFSQVMAGGGCVGGYIPISWCYFEKPIMASFCPPQLRLFNQLGHPGALSAVDSEALGDAADRGVGLEVFESQGGLFGEAIRAGRPICTLACGREDLEGV